MRNLTKICVVIILFIACFNINAQYSIGVKVGANFADTQVEGLIGGILPNQTTYTGYTAGIVGEIPMMGNLSFRPELNYIQKGFTVSQTFDVKLIGIEMPLGAKARTRLNYIEMPLLLKYSAGTETAKAYVIAGPNVSYATNAQLRPVATLIIDFNLPRVDIDLSNDIYQRWELSGTVGVGGEIKVANGKIFSDARYTYGFTNMLNNPVVELQIKNQGFNISAGYAYTF